MEIVKKSGVSPGDRLEAQSPPGSEEEPYRAILDRFENIQYCARKARTAPGTFLMKL
jgi:hypothetical protein